MCFFIIPKNSISENELESAISKDGFFEDDIFWMKDPMSTILFKDIIRIMLEGKSWSKDLLVFGDLGSNCFEILSENNIVQSVLFGIDFTSHYENILSQIIEFCILKGLIILDENINIVSLNFETMKSVITNAPQVKKYNRLLDNKSPE